MMLVEQKRYLQDTDGRKGRIPAEYWYCKKNTCRILVEQEDLLNFGGEDGDDLLEDALNLLPVRAPSKER